MKSPFVLITLALAIGIAIGVFMQNDSDTPELVPDQSTAAAPANPVATNPVVSDIAELNRLLQNEIKARESLEQKIDVLSGQVANFKSNSQYQNTDLSDQLRVHNHWMPNLIATGLMNRLWLIAV